VLAACFTSIKLPELTEIVIHEIEPDDDNTNVAADAELAGRSIVRALKSAPDLEVFRASLVHRPGLVGAVWQNVPIMERLHHFSIVTAWFCFDTSWYPGLVDFRQVGDSAAIMLLRDFH